MIAILQHLDKSVANALLLIVGAGLGQCLFWVSRWANGEQWVMCNFRRTVAAMIGNITALAALLAAGTTDGMSVAAAFFSGLTLGVAADSLLNKGARKEWTDEQREEKKP